MAGHNEVLNFVNKFVNLWKTGHEAKLHVDAQAGQAWVSLQVVLGVPYQPRHGRKPGPSQLRRRARRAEARASQAAAQAADLPPANTDEAVEASASVPLILAAARAAVLVPGNMAAEEVAVLHPTSADVAVQVALLAPPIPAQGSHPSHEGHCGDHHSVPAATRDDPPKHGAQVLFCPDSQYLTEGQRIPQLDGSKDAISSIQCDNCHKCFETRDQLTDHDELHQFGCDDCGICYTSQYFADLHELAEHPGTYYALNIIPHSTKLQFAHSCKS